MLTLIILAWILTQMATPALVWVAYGLLCGAWVINSVIGISKFFED